MYLLVFQLVRSFKVQSEMVKPEGLLKKDLSTIFITLQMMLKENKNQQEMFDKDIIKWS